MHVATLNEIIEQVRAKGSCEVDLNFLQNTFFRGDTQRRMDEWCAANDLKWDSRPYHKGETIIFRAAAKAS